MLHKLEWLVEHLVATLSLNYCKVHSERFLYLCLFSLIFLARLSTRFDNETA